MAPVETLALTVSLILGLPSQGPQGSYPLPEIQMVEVVTVRQVIGRGPQGLVTIQMPSHDFSGWFDSETNRIQVKATCLPDECDPILVHELAHWLALHYGMNSEELARYTEECYRLQHHLPQGWPLMRRRILEQRWRPPGLPTGRCGGS